jgi:hypothetical protein
MAYEDAVQSEERQVHVGPAFVANPKAAELLALTS